MFTTEPPPTQETWTITPNNRIVYSSVVQVMSEFIYGIKKFLTVNGYVLKGSCDGTSASMSGVDYWTSESSCTTRGTSATAAQSWVVLTDGNGVDILIAYQGTSTHIAKISFSSTAAFILAATVTHQPTATDETTVASGADIILANTSGDRVWHGWVNSDATMFRIIICRQGTASCIFGVERFIPLYDTSLTVSKCWGFFYSNVQLTYAGFSSLTGVASALGGVIRYNNSSNVLVNAACTFGGADMQLIFGTSKPEAQGSSGHILCKMFIAGKAATFQGIIGLRIDWLYAFHNNDSALGRFYGSKKWIGLSQGVTFKSGGALWPWDRNSSFITY